LNWQRPNQNQIVKSREFSFFLWKKKKRNWIVSQVIW
jgi:hypothetical protein